MHLDIKAFSSLGTVSEMMIGKMLNYQYNKFFEIHIEK